MKMKLWTQRSCSWLQLGNFKTSTDTELEMIRWRFLAGLKDKDERLTLSDALRFKWIFDCGTVITNTALQISINKDCIRTWIHIVFLYCSIFTEDAQLQKWTQNQIVRTRYRWREACTSKVRMSSHQQNCQLMQKVRALLEKLSQHWSNWLAQERKKERTWTTPLTWLMNRLSKLSDEMYHKQPVQEVNLVPAGPE